MSEPFSRTIHARWGDMDFNGHMRNTAFLDAAADLRMVYFAEHGFTMRELERLGIGPVILRDELEYFRELRLLEETRVTQVAAGLSEDASQFKLRNEFLRMDGSKAARVTSVGGWFDLKSRRLTVPPAGLMSAIDAMPRAEDFVVLDSLVKR